MNHPRLGLPILIPRKRELRKNATKSEQILWKQLRAERFAGIKFRRQHGIGPYIVDFCSARRGLIIEVDGDIHALPNQRDKDQHRQQWLESLGYQVIRYSNEEVFNNLEGVLLDLLSHLEETSPNPSFARRGDLRSPPQTEKV